MFRFKMHDVVRMIASGDLKRLYFKTPDEALREFASKARRCGKTSAQHDVMYSLKRVPRTDWFKSSLIICVSVICTVTLAYYLGVYASETTVMKSIAMIVLCYLVHGDIQRSREKNESE